MAEEKIFQPGWEEAKERQARREKHGHHHYYERPRKSGFSTALGGAMKQHDKQAYYGLRTIIFCACFYGLYKLAMMFVNEWRAMPHDDPTTELTVDELGIHKVTEHDALLYSDSIAQMLNVDTIRRDLQIDKRAPYRPPRKEDNWYISQREWKDIWKTWKRKRYEKKLEKEGKSEE